MRGRYAPFPSPASTRSPKQARLHDDLEILVSATGEAHQHVLPRVLTRDRRKLGDRVLGPDARIVKPRRNGVRLAYLPLVVLEDERARSVKDADAPADDRRRVLAA